MDFLRTTNDWDLEAIIRGWGGGGSGGCSVVQLPPPSPDPFLGFEGFEFDESELATKGVVNELEEMCKPFVVQVEQAKNESPRSSQTETTSASPCSSPFALFDHEDELERPKEMEMEMKESIDLDVEDHAQARSSCKKRKNKHKIVRVVHRGVGEDGVLMDKWNWRKYGQKSIKGSPYPRSYYRCSSSGGCHARKHVEQSKDDRHTFIVTYIADHSHLPPTRRHAQAGRKITKFSSSSSSATNVVNSHNKTPPEHMTWTISNPSIDVEDGDRALLGGGSANAGVAESTGLQVMEELFSAYNSFDHDFNNWEFDPIFTT